MEFDALKDLVNTITRNRVKQIEILGSLGVDDNRLDELYDAISKGKVNSDEEAAKLLCGTDNIKDANFKRIRNRLIRQLINSAFFIDLNQPMFNERAKAYYNCYKDFAAANILINRQANKSAVYLLNQTLEQAEKYEFIDLAADVSKLLKQSYRGTIGDRSNHDHYAKLHRKYEEKRRNELLAFDYFDHLVDYYLVKQSPNSEIHQLATQYYDELIALAEKVDTAQFYFYTYMSGIIKWFSVNDIPNALELCNEGIARLEPNKNSNRAYLSSIMIQKILCLTKLRMFENEEGTLLAQKCLALEEEGNFNWFRAKEVYFQYLLYTKQFELALTVFSETTQHERYKLLGANIKDRWQLFGGYLHLLAVLGKIKKESVDLVVGPFKYVKFNNNFEILDKDKEGMNIPLIILPFMYSLASGDVYQDEYGRSLDALEKYKKRYLDNNLNQRSAYFLNILLAYNKLDTDPDFYKKKIKKMVEALKNDTQPDSGQSVSVEIIPYEDLWLYLNEKTGNKVP
jgi:hypothetical protein